MVSDPFPTKRGWTILAYRRGFEDDIAISIRMDDQIVTGFEFKPYDPRGEEIAPTLVDRRIDVEDGMVPFLRAALNAAWELGLRPDGFEDTRESMKATSRHLEDMRSLVFQKLGATKP